MSSATLLRLSGAALVLSAALTVPGYAIHPAPDVSSFTDPAWVTSHLLLWLGALAGVAGIAGLSLRHGHVAARLSLAGGALAVVGLFGLSGAYFYEALVVPTLASASPDLMGSFPRAETWGMYRAAVAASGFVFGLGFLLLGIAMYRAAILSRWAVGLATSGAIGAGVAFLLPRPAGLFVFALLGAGLVGLGSALWAGARPAASPSRAARGATE